MKRYLSLIWVAFLLVACLPPGIPLSGSTPAAPSPTAPNLQTTPPTPTVPVLAPTLVITDTPGSPPMGTCGYVWATQGLPDVNTKLAQAFQAAGLPDIQANASSYGENCMDPKSNKVVSFSAMETDFNLTIPVKSRTDPQEMGDRLAKALPVLDQFPVGQVPGSNPGYVSVRFKDETGEQNLHFLRTKGQDALKQGLSGSDLYNALLNP